MLIILRGEDKLRDRNDIISAEIPDEDEDVIGCIMFKKLKVNSSQQLSPLHLVDTMITVMLTVVRHRDRGHKYRTT